MSAPARKPGPQAESWKSEATGMIQRSAVTLAVLMIFAVFAAIVVPAMIRERRPLPAAASEQVALTPGWLDEAEAPARKGRDLPPVDPATVMSSTPKLLARGETLFRQNCISCHGDSGRGDGPASSTLNPRPRNFTQPAGWTSGYRITDIFSTITHGVKGTGMAAFDFIAPADRMALVHYVRSLGAFDHGHEDPQATAALANQFRSKGVHIPNRIPVSLASKIMIAEQPEYPPVHLPAANDHSPAAELLRGAIRNGERVARTVALTKPGQTWQDVAQEWAAGAPSNGFAPAVAGMNAPAWQELVIALLPHQAVAEPRAEGQGKGP
ncbi:MAG: c-type cytochrome [Polyangia bacterium]|jgi:mono/diheme cytochrome c family protein